MRLIPLIVNSHLSQVKWRIWERFICICHDSVLFLEKILRTKILRLNSSRMSLWFSYSSFLMLLNVIIKMTLCWERFQAPGDVTVVRLFSSMYSQVSLKISFLVKCSLTFFVGTYKFLLSQVSFKMHLKPLNSAIWFWTSFKSAHILLDIKMSFLMII